jgi:RNA polymerase sigma factor (sigma-70 family)
MDFAKPDRGVTRASLLERLKDLGDQDSWQEFYDTYHMLILSFALRHGLTAAEAEEVVQETVISVARNIPQFRYDPARCAFKTWLLRLTLWRITDQLRKRRPQLQALRREDGSTDRTATIERIPVPEEEDATAAWDAEWEKHLFDRALRSVRDRIEERQFQIFDLYVLQDWPAGEVARSLGVSRTQVYVTKHRIAALLKQEIRRLQKQTPLCAIPRKP